MYKTPDGARVEWEEAVITKWPNAKLKEMVPCQASVLARRAPCSWSFTRDDKVGHGG